MHEMDQGRNKAFQAIVGPLKRFELGRLRRAPCAESPVLNFHDVHWLGTLSNTAGTYITCEMTLMQGVASAKVYAEMDVPSGTSVTWYASNNGGAAWEAMTLAGTRPINEIWTEYTFACTFASAAGSDCHVTGEIVSSR